MSEVEHTEHEEHPEPNYLAVFFTLAVLTAIEIGLTFINMPRGLLVMMLVVLAFVKVGLVALYFMHLVSEKVLLKAIVAIPLIVASILLIGITPDALHKLLRPHIP